MAKKNKVFYITCYGNRTQYKESDRKEQINEYHTAMLMCEGAERDRYVNVYLDLMSGKKECCDL